MSIYAIVQEQSVVNTIIWDGASPWSPDEGMEAILVPDGIDVSVGWAYVDGEFSAPPAPPPHVPTAAEILAKNTSVRQSLMLSAGTAIAPLQDALDLGIIRPEEQALLTQWKTFRVDVSRIDLTLENPGWPVPPGPLYVVEAPGTQNA
jgi:hypothetical protein